jgi:hypothetical protein
MVGTNGSVRRRLPKQREEPPVVQSKTPVPASALAGGRVTIDSLKDTGVGTGRNGRMVATMAPPGFYEAEWRWFDLDSQALRKLRPNDLLDRLVDMSPEVGKAYWDFLRLCNPGWSCVARTFGDDTPDERAQSVLDDFWGRLTNLYGSPDIPINRLFTGAFLRGAFFGEVVLEDKSLGVDLATPDPFTVRFARERTGDARRLAWVPYQSQGRREPVRIDNITVRYVPVDPMPASPYGRPIASPAVFAAVFLLSLFHDLKRVIQQQGYPRLDLSIGLEALATMAPDITGNAEAYGRWVQAVVSQVEEVYATLEPEDAYVHTDVVTVNKPVGATGGDGLSGVEGIISALERMLVRALKTIPLLMVATGGGASEADANRQWELQAAGIKSLQHLCENLLGHLLGVMLQAAGTPAKVRFKFAELRSAEEMRDQQTRKLLNDNLKFEYDQGWRSQDEASMLAVGHLPDEQEPRMNALMGPPTGQPSDPGKLPDVAKDNPDPGSDE